MAKTAILSVKIIGDSKDAISAVDKTESKIAGFGKKAGAAVVAGVAAVGTAAAALGVTAVKAGADLEQSIGAIDTVFKGSADQMHAWSKSAATDVGLTRNEFNELGTLIGTQLKNGGTAMDELAPKTQNLIGLGADLSSMFGGTTADAVGALSSALKGERDPIERYGVSLNQAAIDAKAAELGFKKVGGALSAEANQAATLALIMDQTSDAHGNFARETNTVAHQQQVFMASVKNLVAELGTALLPIALAVFNFLNTTAVPAVKNLVAAFTGAGEGGGLAAKLGLDQLMPILQNLGAMFLSLIPVVKNIFFNVLLPAGQQIAANLIPVIQTIAATVIPALIGALRTIIPAVVQVVSSVLSFAVALSGTLMPIVRALMPVVQTVFSVVSNVVASAMRVISNIIRTITAVITGDWKGAWNGIKATAQSVLNLIKTLITSAFRVIGSVFTAGKTLIGRVWKSAWEAIKTATRAGISSVVSFVKGLPGKIVSGLGNLSGLLSNAGRQVIDGFVGALSAGYQRVKDKLGGLTRLLPSWKGPPSKDKKILAGAGSLVIEGFIKGMESQYKHVERSLGGLTKDVARTSFTAPQIARTTTTAGARTVAGGRVAPTIQINVNGALDPNAVARQIKQLLTNYDALVAVS